MIFIYRTNHSYESGSVSVFFAIIMVVLITFLFTIFDFSRLQFIQLEASSNFDAAAEIALSQYEPLMFHQYGLFAGRSGIEVESVVSDCLKTQFYPDKAQKHTYLLDYYLSEQEDVPKFSLMEAESYEYKLSYQPLISHDYDLPRNQIVEYMKLREPYLLLKPFLSSLDILAKSSRSSSMIEEKNELVSTFNTIEEYKLQLYKLIDGIEIYSNGHWSFLKESNYVRKFTYHDNLNYSYFPSSLQSELKEPLFNYSSFVEPLETLLNSIDTEIVDLLSHNPYTMLYSKDDEPILIAIIENEFAKDAYSSLLSLNAEVEEYYGLEDIISQQLQCNSQALELIVALEDLCKNNIILIDDYQQRLANKDQLIESVKTQINKELNDIKDEMTIGISLNEADNLQLIKSQLESNVSCLSQSLAYVDELMMSIEDYTYRRYLSLKSFARINEDQLLLLNDKMIGFSNKSEYRNSPVEQKTVLKLINNSDDLISQYKSNIIFDYSKLNTVTLEDDIYTDKEQGLLDFDLLSVFKDKGLIKFYPGLNLTEEFLPSHEVSPGLLTEVDFSKMDRGIKEVNKFSLMTGFDFESIKEVVGEAHESFLINEYAIGMFSNVNKVNNPNSKTINGFKIDEHFLDYETEYILAGYLDEQKNMDTVLGYLYGTRLPLNLIHLAVDNTKRTTIMNIANTIAGWWTGGLGAIIIAIVIAGFWALLESVADVFMLVSGEKVPLIKTKSSWYTSLDGNVMELFNSGVKRVENEFIIYMEETEDLIDLGLSGISQMINTDLANSSSDDHELLNSYLEELKQRLVDFGEEVGYGIENFNIDFDSKLDLYINEELEMVMFEEEPSQLANPFDDEESKDLSASILSAIYFKYYHLPIDERDLESLIVIKKEVMNQYDYFISKYKESYKSKIETMYSETISFQLALLEEGASELMKSGTKVGRKLIVDKADEIKEEFLGDYKREISDNQAIEAFIPSFSYEDYLRVFLLLPIVDEERKVARIMDLIQLNTQKVYDDYDISLTNYFVGINLQGSVKVKTLFIPNIDQSEKSLNQSWELEAYHVNKHY